MKQILLLGRNGFIGRNLYDLLADKYEVMTITNKKEVKNIKKLSPDYVINLCASSPNANFKDSLDANVLYPLDILAKLLTFRKSHLKWIQIGSYFELQIEFGRNDYYTLHKNSFRKLLGEIEISNQFLMVQTVILPHITGKGESQNRLFPTLRRFNKEKMKGQIFSNGNQFLPVLNVFDACTAILQSLESNQKISSAQPVLHLRVREIVDKCVTNANPSIFNENLKSTDSNYPMVKFPENVFNFKPKIEAKALIVSTQEEVSSEI
jgi:nucleoside-diphosphate-sugar epimerase